MVREFDQSVLAMWSFVPIEQFVGLKLKGKAMTQSTTTDKEGCN